MITTTFNLHVRIFEIIKKVALAEKTSCRNIIIQLLKMLMNDIDPEEFSFKTVSYQARDDAKAWRCFHMRCNEDEYEFFLDLRKITKCSISLLIARAVKKYLNSDKSVIRKLYTTSLAFKNYLFAHERIQGIYCWRLFWGVPNTDFLSKELVEEELNE